MAIELRALEQLQAFTILAPATRDAAGNTTAVDVSAVDGDLLLLLYAAASASSTALKVKVQSGNASDGSDAADVPGGAFTDLGSTAALQKLSIPRDQVGKFVRLAFTDETGSYSATVSCFAVGGARYAV
jgi:hypothetical protein